MFIKAIKSVKTITVSLLIASMLCAGVNTVYGAESTIKKLTCEKDWYTFISSFISFEESTETWNDVFNRYARNICWYDDIANVQVQLETTRNSIRKTFASCGSNITNLRKKYMELEAELFYVRNFANVTKKEITPVPEATMRQMFNNKFLEDFTDQLAVDTLFEKLKNKYADRLKKAYKECKDPGLQEITLKWKELVNTIKSFKSKSEKLTEEWNKAINTPVNKTGGFLKNIMDARKHYLPILKSPDQILKNLEKGGQTTTMEQFNAAIVTDQQVYVQKAVEASILSEYEGLYKTGGDEIALDFEAKLDSLNTTLKDTYKPIETVTECVKKTAERQCK